MLKILFLKHIVFITYIIIPTYRYNVCYYTQTSLDNLKSNINSNRKKTNYLNQNRHIYLFWQLFVLQM